MRNEWFTQNCRNTMPQDTTHASYIPNYSPSHYRFIQCPTHSWSYLLFPFSSWAAVIHSIVLKQDLHRDVQTHMKLQQGVHIMLSKTFSMKGTVSSYRASIIWALCSLGTRNLWQTEREREEFTLETSQLEPNSGQAGNLVKEDISQAVEQSRCLINSG